MPLAKDPQSWDLALKIASIAALAAVLVVILLWFRNSRK